MSHVPKAFYGFLVFVMLASFAGSWQSLARLHQEAWWPDREQFGYYDYQDRSYFETLTVKTIHVFDMFIGKIIGLMLIAGMSYICGKLTFQHDWLFTGLLALLAFAAYCAWIAIYLRLFNNLIFLIRM